MKQVKTISIQLVSNQDEEDLTIELWGDDVLIGEVTTKADERTLLLYSNPDSLAWKLDLEAFIAALEKAKTL